MRIAFNKSQLRSIGDSPLTFIDEPLALASSLPVGVVPDETSHAAHISDCD